MDDERRQPDRGLPSLDLIAERVQTERDRIIGHAESLDTKAGIILGFAGVVVALRGLGPASWASILGLVLTIVGAAFAVRAFTPRPFPILEVRSLRDLYLRAAPEFTQLRLLDTEVRVIRQAGEQLRRKAKLLQIALVLLLAGVACIAAGVLIAELREVL